MSAFTIAGGAVLNLASFNQSIGSLAGAGSVTLGSATLTTGNDNTSTTFSGTILGSGGLTKIGNGTLTLSGSTTYAGPTVVNAGTLQAGVANAYSAISAFTVASGATLNLASFNQTIGSLAGAGAVTLGPATLTTGNDNTSTTFSGGISGTGGLTKIGSGTLTLSGSSSYSGATAVNAGTLAAGATNVFASGSAFTVASGTTLNLAGFNQIIGSLAGAGSVTLGSATLTTGNDNTSTTFFGGISGTGGLTKIGSGTLTLAGSSSYSGATAVNAGTLAAGRTNTFASSSAFTVASGATLNLASFNQTIGSLAGAGSVMLGSATLTTGNDNTSTMFSGTISGTGGLTKIGSGVLTLSGANTYSGGTTLAAGTLSLANNQALGTGALTTTGSVVDYANGVTIANPIVVNSNTTQLQVLTGTATQAGVISELNGPRPIEKMHRRHRAHRHQHL